MVIPDEEGRILMVKQSHEGKDIWMVPGGAIEAGENAAEAAVREVLEETGLTIRINRLLWHVEEVSETRGTAVRELFPCGKNGRNAQSWRGPRIRPGEPGASGSPFPE